MKYLPLLLISLLILIIIAFVLAIVYLNKPALLTPPTSRAFKYEVDQQPLVPGYYTMSTDRKLAHVAVKVTNLRENGDKVYGDIQLAGEKKYPIILFYLYTPKASLLYDKEATLTLFPDNEKILLLDNKKDALFTLNRIKDKTLVVFLDLDEGLYKGYKVLPNIMCNKKFADMLERNKFSDLGCNLYTSQITTNDL
jgi:hypothetical protein